MSTLNGQWIEVFRLGDYGVKGNYSAADIDRMVAGYNPSHHEAPVVVGHPEHNGPAFGWVEALKREGDTLLAKLRDVQPEFEDLVRRKVFKKRSISFYPSTMTLRHLGFLGAMPPEVKGLKDLRLCDLKDGDREVREVEFNAGEPQKEEEMDQTQVKSTFLESLKEFFGGNPPKAGAPAGEKQFTEADAQRIVEAAVTKAAGPLTTKITELETQLADEKKRNSAVSTRQMAESALGKIRSAPGFVPALEKMGAGVVVDALSGNLPLDKKVAFGEGDQKTEKTPLEVFTEFMTALPKIVPTKALSTDGKIVTESGKVLQFTESKGIGGPSSASVAFHEAIEKRAKEKSISYGDAMTQLVAEGVTEASFAQAGSATAGAV